jgi:hypothetical protein
MEYDHHKFNISKTFMICLARMKRERMENGGRIWERKMLFLIVWLK